MPLPLSCREQGRGEPLVILHGLFGHGGNWGVIAQELARERRVLALDLRNHGRSPHADDAGYQAMAADVLAWLDAAGLAQTDLLGHSLGGKTAMLAALLAPERVRRLLVVDIAPVSYGERHQALMAALMGLDLARVANRADAEAALAPAIPDPIIRAFLLTNLHWRAGQAAWRINLPALARALPQLRAFPADLAGRRCPAPTLVIAGGRSDYVPPAAEAAIARHFPAARVARIADAGHWPHFTHAEPFLALTRAFLAGASVGEAPRVHPSAVEVA